MESENLPTGCSLTPSTIHDFWLIVFLQSTRLPFILELTSRGLSVQVDGARLRRRRQGRRHGGLSSTTRGDPSRSDAPRCEEDEEKEEKAPAEDGEAAEEIKKTQHTCCLPAAV